MPRFAASASCHTNGPGSTNASMSFALRPASCIALTEASHTSRSTVFPEPRVYSVSPRPTMHALSLSVMMIPSWACSVWGPFRRIGGAPWRPQAFPIRPLR